MITEHATNNCILISDLGFRRVD